MRISKLLFHTALALAAIALVATSAAAAGSVIYAGSDMWRTPDDGSTFTDFALDPIPADFFCSGSAPFTGRIEFRGSPLATSPPGALGSTDTIVLRLDDAFLDRRGVGTTRIRVAALSFVSRAPAQTGCGLFDVEVGLVGLQPTTEMRIVREDENGGYFLAPISVVVKLTFTPVGGPAREVLELVRGLDFAPNPNARWADPDGLSAALTYEGFVLVDTDRDAEPDSFLPGTSNFAAGWTADPSADAGGTTNMLLHCGNPPDCTHNHTTEAAAL